MTDDTACESRWKKSSTKLKFLHIVVNFSLPLQIPIFPCFPQFISIFPARPPDLVVLSHLLRVMLLCSTLTEAGRSQFGAYFLLHWSHGRASISAFVRLSALACLFHGIEGNVRQGFYFIYPYFYCNRPIMHIMHYN